MSNKCVKFYILSLQFLKNQLNSLGDTFLARPVYVVHVQSMCSCHRPENVVESVPGFLGLLGHTHTQADCQRRIIPSLSAYLLMSQAYRPTSRHTSSRLGFTLRAKLSAAVYCNRSCLFVCVCVCLWVFVCGSVTTITRNCVHRSSPYWVCR